MRSRGTGFIDTGAGAPRGACGTHKLPLTFSRTALVHAQHIVESMQGAILPPTQQAAISVHKDALVWVAPACDCWQAVLQTSRKLLATVTVPLLTDSIAGAPDPAAADRVQVALLL